MKKYTLMFFVFNFVLGLFILNINSVYALRPVGCTVSSNFSITTGEPCNNNASESAYIPACSSLSGYKLITSQSTCSVSTKANAVFNFKAKDPNNNNLSWSVSWGDGLGLPKICPSSQPNNTLSIGHAWNTAGTYNVKLGVSNCKDGGDALASFNVIVKDSTNVNPSVPTNPAAPISSATSVPVAPIIPSIPTLPAGCTATSNFSIITGYSCNTSSTTSVIGNTNTIISSSATDATGLSGKFVSFNSILLSWNPIHNSSYKGGYNIYRNGSLLARTRTDLTDPSYSATSFYDTTVTCPSTQRYQVELFSYDQYWNIIPSGNLSGIATVVGSTCPSPTTTVLSPNGGESYQRGDVVHITWKATGITTANNSIALSVYKYRSDNNYYGVFPEFGQTLSNPKVGGVIQDNGSFDWTIPSSFSPGDYVVWIAGANATQDTSNAPFSIK